MAARFTLEVIFEDNHLLIVNKQAGLLTQPDATERPSLLELARSWIKEKYGKPGNVFLEAVHRLDRPVSGIVLFAKTSKALSRLNASVREKKMRKVYQAQVYGSLAPSEGVLRHYLLHGEHKAIVSSRENPEAKEARLSYKALAYERLYTVVEIELLTGRYHQIRAQFSSIGFPILRDGKYGGPLVGEEEGIALHHKVLEILHPVSGDPLVFTAPAPWALLAP